MDNIELKERLEKAMDLNWTFGALGEEAHKKFQEPFDGMQSPRDRLIEMTATFIQAEVEAAEMRGRNSAASEILQAIENPQHQYYSHPKEYIRAIIRLTGDKAEVESRLN
jgi:hypothetical protein